MATQRPWCGKLPAGTQGTDIILYLIILINSSLVGLGIYGALDYIEAHFLNKPAPPAITLPSVQPKKQRQSLRLYDFTSLERNALGGSAQIVEALGGLCTAEVLRDDADRRAFMRLSYDVSSPQSSAGYESEIPSVDLTRYRRLSFKVRGETGDEVFRIVFDDGSENVAVSSSQLLPDGIPGDWRTVNIRFDSLDLFKARSVFSGVVKVAFEHNQGMPYSGSICIKDVRFAR